MATTTRLRYALLRLALRTVGRASDGIRLCLDEGLTAGKTLDYVYKNVPHGRWLIGRPIDRGFLAQSGWQAIRTRRANLEALLAQAIAALRATGGPVVILDVASGPGGYILDAVAQAGGNDVSARCWDIEPRWLAEGAAEAARRGLAGVVFEPGDAFDRTRVLGVTPRPNLMVASGFYDWIVEDEAVRRSLAILAEAVAPGGYLALTVQTGHADLALVEAVFTDFHHAPLRMTVRPAATVTSWLAELGLRVVDTRADPFGYYAALLATRSTAGDSGTD